MSGKKGMQHYSVEKKQAAIRMFLGEGLTYREIAEKLEIRKQERIKMWVQDYRRRGIGLFTRHSGRPRKVTDEKTYIARLEMENKLLKNFSPSCKRICSRSAISDSLSLQGRIPSDRNVCLS